jgi:nucleotidyltransferase substrate binding protein (TIGR01987 family)
VTEDVRWKQRFANYCRALATLSEAVKQANRRPLSNLEKQGLIHGFEFTHELAWNLLKDYLTDQGVLGIIGSKNASREAFANGLIEDGHTWMDMIRSRHLTSHTYNVKVAEEIAGDILKRFHPAFLQLANRFRDIETRHGTS